MKTIFNKIYSTIKKVNVLNFFFWSILLLFIHHWSYENLPSSILLTSSFKELKEWYPNFYLLIFLVLKSFTILPYIIIGIQLSFVLFNKHIDIMIKGFLVGILLFTSSYLPDLIWIFPVQCMLVWSYYLDKSPDIITTTNNNNNTKGDKWLVFGVILVAFSIRLIWIFYTDNSGNGDAGMRLWGMKRWVELFESIGFNNGINNVYFVMPSQDWLPLHYYLVGFVGKTTNEWMYSPRILSAIIGSLTIIPLFKLTLLKFNKTAAYISIIIFTFYGYHLFLSSLVLSEVFYIYFVIWAYYIIEKWVNSNSDAQLIPLAFILGCLCLLRYEGWFISFVIIIILPSIKIVKSWRVYFMFAFIVLLFPLFIMICEKAYGFNPLRGLLYSDYEVKIALAKDPKYFSDFLNEFKNAFIPFSFISIIIIGTTILKQKNVRLIILGLLYVIPLLPFFYKLATGTLTSQARYISLYMVPLIPMVAYILSKLYKTIQKWKFIILFPCFILFLNLPFYQQIKNQQIILRYSPAFHESAAFVKQMKKGHFYLDNEFQWGEFNWQVDANIYSLHNIKLINQRFPKELIYNHDLDKQFVKNVISTVELERSSKQEWDSRNFDKLLLAGSISHILLYPNGELSKQLKFSELKEGYLGIIFFKVFEKDNYFIYEVQRNNK